MGFDGTSRGVAGRENRCRRGRGGRPGKTFSGAGFGRECNYTIFAAINRPAILPGSNKLYMKDFFSILRRFVPPYKYYLVLNIFFNILASILTLFSFALIIPILEILFKLKQATYTFMPWGSASLKDVAVNNFYYYITNIINEQGAGFALLILGVFLMVMTFFKTTATYLSSHFMIPLRSGLQK